MHCHLTIHNYNSKVRCFVTDVGVPYLVDPCVHQQQAILTSGCEEATVGSVASYQKALQCASSKSGADDDDLAGVAHISCPVPDENGRKIQYDAQQDADSGAAHFSFNWLLSAVQCERVSGRNS